MEDGSRLKEIIAKRIGDIETVPEKKGKGGARPGAGRKPGGMNQATKNAMAVKKEMNNRIAQNVDKLLNAQLGLALGETFLFVKRSIELPDGKRRYETEMVEDIDTIKEYVDDDGYSLNNNGEDYYFISRKPANNQAIDSLLNRAFGKATEKVEIEGGFFKAETLNIQIVNPEIPKIEDGNKQETDYIEVVDETEPDSRSAE